MLVIPELYYIHLKQNRSSIYLEIINLKQIVKSKELSTMVDKFTSNQLILEAMLNQPYQMEKHR